MARIGNEARLILKLAEEKIASCPKLTEEQNFRSQPGNHPEKVSLSEAIKIGYLRGIRSYIEVLSSIVAGLEDK